jgi:hypothetical protein
VQCYRDHQSPRGAAHTSVPHNLRHGRPLGSFLTFLSLFISLIALGEQGKLAAPLGRCFPLSLFFFNLIRNKQKNLFRFIFIFSLLQFLLM